MKIDDNFAAIHAYLCADGYVIKNPPSQKQKYYKIGFRNINLILLKDFQEKFEKVFGIKPHLRKDGRCELGSKSIYEELINKFGSFHSHKWSMLKLDTELSKIWLRAYFDCEGWVFCKSHQNRHIGADCINERGLSQVIKSLNKLGIKTIKKINNKRKMHRVLIYGKENIIRFKNIIGFLHPEKLKRLNYSLQDYIEYKWSFPNDNKECEKFVKETLIRKLKIRRRKYVRMFSKEKENLDKLKDLLKKYYKINSVIYKCVNGYGTVYYELNINKKSEIQKLINLKIIPNILENV